MRRFERARRRKKERRVEARKTSWGWFGIYYCSLYDVSTCSPTSYYSRFSRSLHLHRTAKLLLSSSTIVPPSGDHLMSRAQNSPARVFGQRPSSSLAHSPAGMLTHSAISSAPLFVHPFVAPECTVRSSHMSAQDSPPSRIPPCMAHRLIVPKNTPQSRPERLARTGHLHDEDSVRHVLYSPSATALRPFYPFIPVLARSSVPSMFHASSQIPDFACCSFVGSGRVAEKLKVASRFV